MMTNGVRGPTLTAFQLSQFQPCATKTGLSQVSSLAAGLKVLGSWWLNPHISLEEIFVA